jgi:carboxypeptidase family protein
MAWPPRPYARLVTPALLLFLTGCRGAPEETPASRPSGAAPAPASEGMYVVTQVADGGRVAGRVLAPGTPSAPSPIVVTKDHEVCGKTQHHSESLLVGPGGGVKNAVVSIAPIRRGKAFPAGGRPALDQRGCWFVPHVQVVPAGVEIDIINSDGILHNIHTFPKRNPPINMAQPKFKKVLTHAFALPDVVRVACDVHNWMNAWIIVADHPYHAVTAEDGSFDLTEVPPGSYTLTAWHETLGHKEMSVDVTPGGATEVTLTF